MFEPPTTDDCSERPAIADPGELHVCADCRSTLVYPVDWSPVDDLRWSVWLRCPECEWHFEGVYGQQFVNRFDDELDRGTERLLADLERLARANLAEEVERVRGALNAGAILPEDF